MSPIEVLTAAALHSMVPEAVNVCSPIVHGQPAILPTVVRALAQVACRESLEAAVVRRRVELGIATVIDDPNEPSVYGSKSRDASVLASLVSFEGGLNPYVDDGRCNDTTWRATHADILRAGDCDGGHAWTEFQIHAEGGLALVGTGWSVWKWAPAGSVKITGPDLVADPSLAARVALHILRQNGMTGYTGEGRETHPKADTRLKRAKKWLATYSEVQPCAQSTSDASVQP